MDPNEFMRRYWDTWMGFGRSFMSGGVREVPFPDGESQQHHHSHRSHAGSEPSNGGQQSRPSEGVENAYAREFLAILGRINGLSEAQAKIAHAWISIFLNRMGNFVSDSQGRDNGSPQRKLAMEELLDGYVSFSREYMGAWNALFANVANQRQGR